MLSVIRDFEDRCSDLDRYINFLELLHQPDAAVFLPHKAREEDKLVPVENEVTTILKANVFLILYNIVESSIREGILSIYSEMSAAGCSYNDIRKEIREIWTRCHYRQSFDLNASWDTYYKKALELIENIIQKEVIRLDRNAIPISGNLDADKVRLICDLHGIKKTVHRAARGGASLEQVKEQRNLLAHGSLGFTECGRQFDISQLLQIKKETFAFVKAILFNIKDYLDNKSFLDKGAVAGGRGGSP